MTKDEIIATIEGIISRTLTTDFDQTARACGVSVARLVAEAVLVLCREDYNSLEGILCGACHVDPDGDAGFCAGCGRRF